MWRISGGYRWITLVIPRLGKYWAAHTGGSRAGVYKISKQIDQSDLIAYPPLGSQAGLNPVKRGKQTLHNSERFADFPTACLLPILLLQ